jgi:WD40 repeat protein
LGSLLRVIMGHKYEISSLVICPNTETLTPIIVSGSSDKTIRLWNFNTGEEYRRLEMPHDRTSAAGDINTVAVVLPNITSQYFLLGSNDSGTVTIWDMTMMSRGLSPLADDILIDFMRDCKGYRGQALHQNSAMIWPRMSELFSRYGSHDILFLNARLFAIAVLWDKPAFIANFLCTSVDGLINCQWERYLDNYCNEIECKHIIERVATLKERCSEYDRLDDDDDEILGRGGRENEEERRGRGGGEGGEQEGVRDNVQVTRVGISLLFFAMSCQNKTCVEAVTRSLSTLLLIPPTHSPYAMYHHLSRKLASYDILLLADFYPLIFKSFITSLRPIEAHFMVLDSSFNKDPLFHIDLDGSALHRGTTNPFDDYGLWPTYAEKKREKHQQLQQHHHHHQHNPANGEYLNASALMPMFLPLQSTATLSFLRLVLQVSETLEDYSLFQTTIVYYSLRFIWQKIGVKVHVLLLKEYILFVLFYSAACSQYGTNYFGSNIDGIISVGLHCLLLMIVFQLMIQEYIQFSYSSSCLEHFQDIWNIIDFMNITLCIGGSGLRALYQEETTMSRICFAIGFITIYGRILYFLRAFKSVGPLGKPASKPSLFSNMSVCLCLSHLSLPLSHLSLTSLSSVSLISLVSSLSSPSLSPLSVYDP